MTEAPACTEVPTLVRKIIREQRAVYGHELNENLLFEIAKACVYAGVERGRLEMYEECRSSSGT